MKAVYNYKAKCIRVIDGDTYILRVDLGFRTFVEIPIRLRGIDTPERNTELGKKATQWVRVRLMPTPYPEENPELIIETHKSRTGKDEQSFARWVADIWVDGSDTTLAEELVEAGFKSE